MSDTAQNNNAPAQNDPFFGTQTGGVVGDDGVGGNQPQLQGQQPQPQQQPVVGQVGRVAKEEEPLISGLDKPVAEVQTIDAERVPLVEVGEAEIAAEVAEYVKQEKKEELELDEKVEHKGKQLVGPAGLDDATEVVLPMTKTAFNQGLWQKVTMSARWLAEWCFRVIKKFHGRVVYARDTR